MVDSGQQWGQQVIGSSSISPEDGSSWEKQPSSQEPQWVLDLE